MGLLAGSLDELAVDEGFVLNHYGARAEMIEEVSRSVREAGQRILAVEADVARRAEVAAMVEHAVDEFGRIDILVNNAGIAPECPLQKMTDDIWDRVLAVNLKGQFLVCQAVVPHLRAAGYGRIVNIASEQGIIGAVDISGGHCRSQTHRAQLGQRSGQP